MICAIGRVGSCLWVTSRSAGPGGFQVSDLCESRCFHLSSQEEGKALLFNSEFLYNLERLFSTYKKILAAFFVL